MTGFLVVAVIAAAFVLAALYGKDSRPVERGHHRPNL
jgi:hypothetical protein